MKVAEGTDDLRPEIALGWQRSELSGLIPGMEVREPRLVDIDRHSRLVRAASPVLTKMIEELDDTRFSILLADHSARIVDRRLGSRSLDRQLDRVKAVPGVQYVEELSGTNSLATAFELRRPIAVSGDEHYLEALRMFCCYGAPIIHPLTGRLEGVLDLTGPVADQSALLAPFLMRAVDDIAQRLQEGSRRSEQRLFAQFQFAAARSNAAIVMFGENMVLSNARAADIVTADDHGVLRVIAADIGPGQERSVAITLASGRSADVLVRSIADGRDGVLLEIWPRTAEPSRADRRRPASEAAVTAARTVVVSGGPGSGKTTRAAEIAGDGAVRVDAVEFARQLRARTTDDATGCRPLIVDDLHLASAADAARIRHAVAGEAATVVLVAASDTASLSDEHLALLACGDIREEIPDLRSRGPEFAGLVSTVVALLLQKNGCDIASSSLRVTPSAIEVLAEQDWPGNLTELSKVLALAIGGRTSGDIALADLPESHRMRSARALTPLERAERATIISVLDRESGNKVAAAQALGIGRNTLYQRLKYYQIGG